MTTTNSFWREVLDYLPDLTMIFRIDKNDQVQLIFVNKKIGNTLGYNPQEFVLASETNPMVRRELDDLVEEIARLSHRKSETDKQETTLHTKRGDSKHFVYHFELFKVKSSPANFLSISFKDGVSNRRSDADTAASFFVAESPAMKAVMKNVDDLITTEAHILICGEKSTGKKTIASMITKPAELSGSTLMEADAGNGLSSLPDNAGGEKESLILLIKRIDKLSKSDQGMLKEILNQRESNGLKTRVIATSSRALESLLEQNKFETDLYYMLSFRPVLLPPLRNRAEDILKITEQWIKNISGITNLPALELSATERGKLTKMSWEGNFEELFTTLQKSILSSQNGKFSLSTEAGSPHTTPEMDNTDNHFLTYDEMNRRYLRRVLKQTQDKIYGKDGAANLLGLKPTTLQSKLKKLGIR